MPDNGMAKRMNRTPKNATVKRHRCQTHDELRAHLRLILDARNHARRLKAPRGLIPCEFTCQVWTKEPDRGRINPSRHTPELNI